MSIRFSGFTVPPLNAGQATIIAGEMPPAEHAPSSLRTASTAALADLMMDVAGTLALQGTSGSKAASALAAAGSLPLVGSAVMATRVRANVAGTITIDCISAVRTTVRVRSPLGLAAGELPLEGAATVASPIAATVAGGVPLEGHATMATALVDRTLDTAGDLLLVGSAALGDEVATPVVPGGIYGRAVWVRRYPDDRAVAAHGELCLTLDARMTVAPLPVRPDPAPAWELEPWSIERDSVYGDRELVPAGAPDDSDDELLALFHFHEA